MCGIHDGVQAASDPSDDARADGLAQVMGVGKDFAGLLEREGLICPPGAKRPGCSISSFVGGHAKRWADARWT